MQLDIVKLKEIKPVLSEYILESQALMSQSVVPDEKVVHEVRVLMKKARSVLRLASSQLDVKFYSREILVLREVGRILSFWRETSVLRKALKEIKRDHPDIFLKLENNERLNILMKKPEPAGVPSDEELNRVDNIIEILKKTGYRIRFEPLHNFDPQLLIKSLEATYNCVVDNYLICRNNQRQAKFHEFRKRSKDFLYQLWFFRPLNPSVVKALEKNLDVMTNNLGKYNDLEQIINSIHYKYKSSANNPALDEFAVIIKELQDSYLRKVWPTAYKIFCPGQKLVNLLGFKLLVI
jgi:CHAD domain-containing protein